MYSISEKEMQKLLLKHPNMKKCSECIGTCNVCGPNPATCRFSVYYYTAEYESPLYCLKER